MRHLNSDYPYQKPSSNRSSKDLNLIIGMKPFFRTCSMEQLKEFAKHDTSGAQKELTRRLERQKRRAAAKNAQ